MKFKKVLITVGSLAIVTGLLVGCSTIQPVKENVNEPYLSEKENEEDRENREIQGEVTIRIDAIDGDEITASVVELNSSKNTTTPSEKPDKEMSQPQIEYNVTDEIITFTINEDTEFKSFGKDEDDSITLDDLKVGDILSIDLDENNNATDAYFSPMNQVENDKDINQQEDNQ